MQTWVAHKALDQVPGKKAVVWVLIRKGDTGFLDRARRLSGSSQESASTRRN